MNGTWKGHPSMVRTNFYIGPKVASRIATNHYEGEKNNAKRATNGFSVPSPVTYGHKDIYYYSLTNKTLWSCQTQKKQDTEVSWKSNWCEQKPSSRSYENHNNRVNQLYARAGDVNRMSEQKRLRNAPKKKRPETPKSYPNRDPPRAATMQAKMKYPVILYS